MAIKFFRQLFTKNLGLKFISLILAFAFWRVITTEDIAEIGFSVPLELRNIPDGVEVVGDVVNTVNVRVRSSSRIINRLSSADMYISIDLAHAPLGEHTYPLSNKNVQGPVGVEIVRVIPTHVKLHLERTIHRVVPVIMRWQGSVPDFKGAVKLEASPQTVSIEGPESHVDAVSQVTTDMIDLSTITLNQTVSVNLSVDDPTIRLSREKVDVHVSASAKPRPPGKNPAN